MLACSLKWTAVVVRVCVFCLCCFFNMDADSADDDAFDAINAAFMGGAEAPVPALPAGATSCLVFVLLMLV